MHIVIIETGQPPPAVAAEFGRYPGMFERLLAPLSHIFSFSSLNVEDGGALPGPDGYDGLLMTGSPAGVYESHAWIAPLEEMIREAAAAKRPQVGICFGHQLMAQSFGGEVKKVPQGWGVGLHTYEVKAAAPWLEPAPASFSCAVSHQDQVVSLPPGVKVLAGSDFCPNGTLEFSQGPAISFQMHPEFSTEFAASLLRARRGRIPDERLDDAMASLSGKSDRHMIAQWMANFYLMHS